MKYANNISIRVFCRKDENQEQISEGLLKITNFSKEEFEKEKIQIKKTEAEGFEEKIIILEVILDKNRHVNKVLENIKNNLNEKDIASLIQQKNRLDKKLDFFMRLSKPLILENTYELTDAGDCYHIKINLAAYPKKEEVARNLIKEIFS